MSSSSPGRIDPREALWLALLAAAALGLRAWGLGFGLPLQSNFYIRPDETLLVVPAAELLARQGNPGHLNYPAFMIELLCAVFRAAHAVLALLGSARDTFLEDFSTDPSRYFLLGRAVSATCGAAATLAVQRLARRWCAVPAAGLAALLYAVSPLAVREAHYAVTDTLLSLLVAATLLAACRYLEAPPDRQRRALIACGLLAGMALATKYNAVILLPALALALLWDQRRTGRGSWKRDLVLLLAVAAGTFLLLNPWLLLHPGELMDWARTLYQSVYGHRPRAGGRAVGPRGLARVQLYASFLPGLWLGVGLAVTGLLSGAARLRTGPDGRLAGLLAVFLGFVALLWPAKTLPFRYLAPVLPLAAVLAGIGLDTVLRRTKPVARPWLLGAVGVLGIASTLPATIRINLSMMQEDSRSEAGRWLADHVPADVPIVWLGEPESEPQWQESVASLRRRIAYVEGRYGPVAARVIDRIYLLQMDTETARSPRAREVFRNPSPGEVPSRDICVVQADYPLPMVRSDATALAAWTRGGVTRSVTIGSPPVGKAPVLDPSDAWFLPMNPAGVTQPGPRIRLCLARAPQAP